jgi:hypothetical protein
VEDTRACAAITCMAQSWLKLDDFNHELPRTSDAGLHVWVKVVGDDGDVDGQLIQL